MDSSTAAIYFGAWSTRGLPVTWVTMMMTRLRSISPSARQQDRLLYPDEAVHMEGVAAPTAAPAVAATRAIATTVEEGLASGTTDGGAQADAGRSSEDEGRSTSDGDDDAGGSNNRDDVGRALSDEPRSSKVDGREREAVSMRTVEEGMTTVATAPIVATGEGLVLALRDEAAAMEDRTMDAGSSMPNDVARTGEHVANKDVLRTDRRQQLYYNVTTRDHMTASDSNRAIACPVDSKISRVAFFQP